MERKIFKTEIGGREVSVEIGAYCGQANGSCLIRCGETVVLTNATMAKTPRDGIDFFPLGVDFEEKMFAVGKIPGGFKKREGRPSDKAILTSRLIDRPIRPLFPKGCLNDVAVVATALSVDKEIPPEVFGMLGSSIALSISDIPFAGPTASVVVGYVDGKYIINPTPAEREKSKLHLSLAGTKDAIMMVEAGANIISEKEMLDAILFGHEEIKKIITWIEGIQEACGKAKQEVHLYLPSDEVKAAVFEWADKKMDYVLDTFDRTEREARDEADDAGWVVFEPLHAWDDREFDEADGHGQRHEQRVHGDAFGGPAAGVGDACGVRVVRTGHRFVCGLISCGIGGIARRGYTHVELRFFHPDCNRWPRILTGSAAFAGRGLRYGAVMNAGRAVTASKDFHLP